MRRRTMQLALRKCTALKGPEHRLSSTQVRELLGQLKGWQVDGETLRKTVVLPNFVAAIALVNKVADTAEQQAHHPDMAIRYNKVEFTLSTHDVGGLSENDFILAAKIDALV